MRTGETEWMEPLESTPAAELTKALIKGLIFVKSLLRLIKSSHVGEVKNAKCLCLFVFLLRASKHSTDATKASYQTSRGILKPSKKLKKVCRLFSFLNFFFFPAQDVYTEIRNGSFHFQIRV